jgi:hydrogenase maturation protease
MTSGSVELLVLGLGNPLLGDDGAGLLLLSELWGRLPACGGFPGRPFAACRNAGQPSLPASLDWGERVEFLDGGTQGLMLLGRVSRRPALLILDAVSMGAAPGTVHVLRDMEALGLDSHHSRTAHEGNAAELLAAALLLGECPERFFVVGIEPANVNPGIGLSEPVRAALRPALSAARAIVEEVLAGVPAPVA